jgi:hypothetical protein
VEFISDEVQKIGHAGIAHEGNTMDCKSIAHVGVQRAFILR